ncbi:MAG: GAF domain-containing protein, partial [Deltaproteobacteria bacterium]|nr:GAF domain-containing protein [Deltaproteobacteria bacterium]
FTFRSAISVPLTINRHPWGVIEIAGLSPNQFRWENQNLLSDLVEIISPILYQHLVLKSLQELNQNIFHHITPLENYNKICDIISRIFFAGAATLWLPDMEKPEIYKCVGAFNRPDITKKLHEAIDLLTFLSEDTSDSLAARSLTVDKPFLYELINKKKHLKNHQKELPGMGFKGRLAYPLRNFEKKVLGVFSLYYKHDISFGDVWHPTFRFISQFLSLLFEAMQAEQDWERSIRQTIAHEVKQKVDAIFDSVESLKYKIKRGELTSGTMDLILDDLQANKKELHETMLILGQVSLKQFRNVEHPALSLAALQKEKIELSLRKFFNRCFRPTFQLRREKKMKDEYIGPLKGPYILCNSNRLKDIMDNLVNN